MDKEKIWRRQEVVEDYIRTVAIHGPEEKGRLVGLGTMAKALGVDRNWLYDLAVERRRIPFIQYTPNGRIFFATLSHDIFSIVAGVVEAEDEGPSAASAVPAPLPKFPPSLWGRVARFFRL